MLDPERPSHSDRGTFMGRDDALASPDPPQPLPGNHLDDTRSYSIAEIAEATGFSYDTVLRAIRNHQLIAARSSAAKGASYRLTGSAVKTWVRNRASAHRWEGYDGWRERSHSDTPRLSRQS